LVAVIVGSLLGRTTPTPAQGSPAERVLGSDDVIGDDGSAQDTIRVHVSGMVVAPGVVDVLPGAIVAEAIDAAGGLRAGAVVDQINLAAPVSDGDQIVVPGGAGPGTPDAGPQDGLLSLSRATAAELEALPGVGPVLAERIVSFRDQNGGFETVEDLLEVPGIGEAKLGAIRDLVRP
jgi:competence protein ComEA